MMSTGQEGYFQQLPLEISLLKTKLLRQEGFGLDADL
jgi:hypothetical protein